MENNTQKENKLGTTLEMFTKEEIKDLEERIKDVKIYEKDIENLEKTDTPKKKNKNHKQQAKWLHKLLFNPNIYYLLKPIMHLIIFYDARTKYQITPKVFFFF